MPTFDEIHYAITQGLFTSPKPKAEQSDEDIEIIESLELQGNLMIQRKDDGHGHVNVVGKTFADIQLYTLGLNLTTPKYPGLITDLLSLRLPRQTIICSEISCKVNGIQDRTIMGRITNSSVQNALKLQADGLSPEMALFNALMWNGEDTSTWSNIDRYQCLVEHLRTKSVDRVRMVELIEFSLAEAREQVRAKGWEGLVLYDKNAETKFSIGAPGKKRPDNPRPYGAWKDKEGKEGDFVAYGCTKSDAPSHKGAVKDLYIGLLDPVDGRIVPCGKVGTGLSREQRFELAKPGALPIAVEVAFEQWTKYGKLSQGTVTRIREPQDKNYMQCVATQEQLDTILSDDRIEPTW